MSSDNKNDERKKVALTLATYDKLKTFSRINGLKLRMVVDSMVNVILDDEQLGKRIVGLTIERESQEDK